MCIRDSSFPAHHAVRLKRESRSRWRKPKPKGGNVRDVGGLGILVNLADQNAVDLFGINPGLFHDISKYVEHRFFGWRIRQPFSQSCKRGAKAMAKNEGVVVEVYGIFTCLLYTSRCV